MSDLVSPSLQHDGSVTFGDDKRLWVQFKAVPVLQGFASEQAGRPIYESVDMIEVRQPGERDAYSHVVTDIDRHRFRDRWLAYLEGKHAVQTGTPIATLYPSEPHLVKQMEALHVHTVEQLAGISEAGMARLGMGGRAHVERAAKFLDAADRMSGVHKIEGELLAAREQMAAMAKQNEAMAERLADLETKRGPGRPRKETPDGVDI